MFRLIGDTNIDFMRLRRVGYLVSALLVLAGLAAMGLRYSRSGHILNFGIDFAGGTVVQVKFREAPPVVELRERLEAQGLGKASIQTFGESDANEVLIRVEEQTEETRNIAEMIIDAMWSAEERQRVDSGLLDLNNVGRSELAAALARAEGKPGDPIAEAHYSGLASEIVDYRTDHLGLVSSWDELGGLTGVTEKVRGLLEQTFFLGRFTVLRVESVGPAVGADLKQKAFWAIISAIIGILIYIWVRFELRFGVAAVICLAHDVLVTVGAFALTGREVDLPVVAALLTIVGYSLNDTIVVFDRVRDNLKTLRRMPLGDIINRSINEMLSRTLLTSLTTLFVVLSLFLFGGAVINGFAFALLVGVVIGTYSSTFVASAFVLEWSNRRRARARARS